MLVLAINSGSSSLKCAVVDPESGQTLFAALVEQLGSVRAQLRLTVPDRRAPQSIAGADHTRALDLVLSDLRTQPTLWNGLGAVGHRVVHGGEAFTASARIDSRVLDAIRACIPLAPLHNPANVLGIEAAQRALPELPHVAVFDTAFHQTMPEAAYRYAVPSAWYLEHGVRRYGFHGTSHRFVAEQAAVLLGRPLSELNLLTAHLGNGCSAAAVQGGVCVDTTMGFTPLEGLVMGTRSGDIDPAVIFHLEKAGLEGSAIERALNFESGLLGLSGLSNDMRTLSEHYPQHPGARLAIDVFCHRLAKHLGALATSFGHVDAVVFTGGIGEHSSLVRRQVTARLGLLGVVLDEEANDSHASRISAEHSRAAVLVVPTNEELLIARDALAASSSAPDLENLP